MNQFEEQMEAAKFSLILDYESVFICTVLFNLTIEENSDIPTARTNGKCIQFNPVYFNSLTLAKRIFLIAHEVWHVCFNHMGRLEDRDPEKFNDACDYVINLMLVNSNYQMPTGGLLDPSFVDMSAEEVYDLLPDNPSNPNAMGNDITYTPDNAKDELTEQLIDIICRATTQAQLQNEAGSIPDSITRMVKEILYPELPYGVLLDKYFNDRAHEDYSWSKRNRRFPDVYLPSLYSERMGTLAVYIDASCSVSNDQFTEYISLLIATKEKYNPRKMIIVDFDTEIKEVRELHDSDSARDLVFVGGGGTQIRPTMEHIQANDAEVNIIITDGYFHSAIPDNFNKEVIWLIDNNKNFSSDIGHIIHIN